MNQPTRLLDVNVLIALTNPAHIHHTAAHRWFPAVDSWATTPLTQSAFIRLMLNPAVAGDTLGTAEVLGVLARLTALTGHTLWADDTSLLRPEINLAGLVGHKQVTAFHLLNLAAKREGVLATFDRAILRALVTTDHHLVEVIGA